MQRGDSVAVMCLLTLLRHLAACLPEYERLLQHCHASLLAKYTSIATSMRLNVVQCLDTVLEGVRGDASERALPRDGTVHQQTSNTLFFVQQLQ
ncbi:Exocyst complex component Exo70, partial [Trinorchestia longiramus]